VYPRDPGALGLAVDLDVEVPRPLNGSSYWLIW